MGFGLALAAGALVGGAMIGASLLGRGKGSQLKPATLDSFRATQAQEGTPIPFVRGRVRIPLHILWYGNLETKEAKAAAGGKGFMGGGASAGFQYWLDLWYAVCQGPGVSLVGAYINDVYHDLADLGSYEFNDGNDGTYPTEPGVFASPLTGVAHLFLDRYFLGINTTQVPTIHLVVDVQSTAPLTYANLANGCNPAAFAYDLCVESDISPGDIDLTSFQAAADYWYARGYGVNIALTTRQDTREHINDLLKTLGGAFRQGSDDRYYLKAFVPGEAAVKAIPETAFKAIKFKRRMYTQSYTSYTGKFRDEDQDYSERTVRAKQGAVRRLLGYNRPFDADLLIFRDGTTASKRIHEMMEVRSYPEGQIDATLGPAYSVVNEGDVVTVTHSRYGLSAERYRCHEKRHPDDDGNDLDFKFVQASEDVAMDTNYAEGGESSWSTPSYAPVALSYQDVFELPYNSHTGKDPAYLLLAARAGVETSFASMISFDGSDYTLVTEYTTFSQHGVLDAEYPDTTLSIDDLTGIQFTPTRDDPTFDTISRTALFAQTRFAVIDDEIIAFQTVTPGAGSSYVLTGCIRGILNTPIQTHAAGATVWLTELQNNVLTGIAASSFYLKLLPSFNTQRIGAAAATPISVTSTAKAATPWPPTRVEVVKSGSTNTVTVWPTTEIYDGSGVTDGGLQTDKENPDFEGNFEWYTSIDATIVAESARTWVVTQAGAFTLYVRSNVSGYASDWQSITVSAGNATYIGPEI